MLTNANLTNVAILGVGVSVKLLEAIVTVTYVV